MLHRALAPRPRPVSLQLPKKEQIDVVHVRRASHTGAITFSGGLRPLRLSTSRPVVPASPPSKEHSDEDTIKDRFAFVITALVFIPAVALEFALSLTCAIIQVHNRLEEYPGMWSPLF